MVGIQHFSRRDHIQLLKRRIEQRRAGETSDNTGHEQIGDLSSLYNALTEEGERDEAFDVQQQIVDLRERLPPTHSEYLADLAESHDVVGRRSLGAGDYTTALVEGQTAVHLRRHYLATAHRLPEGRQGLASSLNIVYRANAQLRRWQPALAAITECVDLLQTLRNEGHDVDLTALTYNLSHLSEAYAFNNREDEAYSYAQQAVDLSRTLGPNITLPRTLVSLATRLLSMGRAEEAYEVAMEAVNVQAQIADAKQFDRGTALMMRAKVFKVLERREEAIEDIEAAIEVYRDWYGQGGGAGLRQAQALRTRIIASTTQPAVDTTP